MMKSIITLVATLLLVSNFADVRCQEDQNKMFEMFLDTALQNFSSWIIDHGLAPDPLVGDGAFQLESNNTRTPTFQITGEFKNRFYHGAERNISARNITVNLESQSFLIDFFYGGGSSDSIQGEYSVSGSIIELIPVAGSGNFSRTNQSTLPFHVQQSCGFEVTSEGHFGLTWCSGSNYGPKFLDFNLDNFDASGNEWRVKPFIEAWYDMDLMDDFPNTVFHWYDYMEEVFAATPIGDIIGNNTLPVSREVNHVRKSSPVRSKDIKYDERTDQFVQVTSVRS